jgi:CheY-like chemotaxis protein
MEKNWVSSVLSCVPDTVDARTRRAIMARVRADTVALYADSPGETRFAGMKILVVDDDNRNSFAMTALLEKAEAVVVTANNGLLALLMLERNPDIDVILMDIMMPSMDGYTTIRAIRSIDRFRFLPIIAISAKVLTGERERCIDAGADDYVPKPVTVVSFFETLTRWAPAALHANRGLASPLPKKKASAPSPTAAERPPGSLVGATVSTLTLEGTFAGLRVLAVDDDFRNLFAIAALLEKCDAVVVTADSGPDALAALERHHDIGLVLMDIMMPGMDGYATIRAIRSVDRLLSLPIIAVTAKVVRGERERCIDAGANDYVLKPVDVVPFLATLSRWVRIVTATSRVSAPTPDCGRGSRPQHAASKP